MNLANDECECDSNILCGNFSQDCSSVAVGLKTGFRCFSLEHLDKICVIYETENPNYKEIRVISQLNNRSLIAIVSIERPRCLQIYHCRKGIEICSYNYPNTILAIKISSDRLVVCIEDSIYIHDMHDFRILHTIRGTPPNPSGLCTLSSGNASYLAYPANRDIGEVQLFDVSRLRDIGLVIAHKVRLAAIAFNATGNLIATASTKGTIIRVFSVPDGQKLFDFRRGLSRCAVINCLAFSSDSLFLCCSSDTETVHVFKLEKESVPEEPQGWIDYFGQKLMASASYLPGQVSDVLSQDRAFAQVRLNSPGLRNLCTIANIREVQCLLVLSQDGFLYVYKLDVNKGGECAMLKQFRVDSRLDRTVSAESLSETPAHPCPSHCHRSEGSGSGSPLSYPQHLRRSPVVSEVRRPSSSSHQEGADKLLLDDVEEFPPMWLAARRQN